MEFKTTSVVLVCVWECVGVYSGLQWVVVKRLRLPAAQDKAQETSDWNHNCDRVAQHPLHEKKARGKPECQYQL